MKSTLRVLTLCLALLTPVIVAPSGHASEPDDAQRAWMASAVDAVFVASNDVWEEGAEARQHPAPDLVAAVGGLTKGFDDQLQRSLELRATVVDEGMQIVSSRINVDSVEIDSTPTGPVARASVTTLQEYVEQTSQEQSEAGWTDVYEISFQQDADSMSVALVQLVAPPSAPPLPGDPIDPPGPPSVEDRDSATSMDEELPLPLSTTSSTSLVSVADLPRSYNVDDFVTYALYWTQFNEMNPDYPNFENDCANFASQAFNKSGWSRTGGYDPRNLDNWDDNLTGPAGASYTWAGARYLAYYAWEKRRLAHMKNIWNARKSDVYFLDWDNDGDTVIDHVALVTGRTDSGVPRISQKTSNRHNMLLTTWIQIIADSTGPEPIWYGRKNRVRD